jgi:hypothetical protein
VNRCPGRESNRVISRLQDRSVTAWASCSMCDRHRALKSLLIDTYDVWNVEIPLCLIRCIESEGLDTCWKLVMSFTLMPLWLVRKSSRYPLDRWLYGPQNWSGHTKIKELPPTRNRTPSFRPNQSRVWLSYLAFCHELCTSSCVVHHTTWFILTVSVRALFVFSTSFVRIYWETWILCWSEAHNLTCSFRWN